MIYASFADCERYENLHPRFKQLFDYLKNNDLENAELGRIELDGENLYINNVNPELLNKDEQSLEYHRDYIDVHLPFNGKEIIGIKPLSDCKIVKSEYFAENDCGLFDDKPTNFVTLYPYQFMIVFPEDAHAPIIGEGNLRKMVAKIKIL